MPHGMALLGPREVRQPCWQTRPIKVHTMGLAVPIPNATSLTQSGEGHLHPLPPAYKNTEVLYLGDHTLMKSPFIPADLGC